MSLLIRLKFVTLFLCLALTGFSQWTPLAIPGSHNLYTAFMVDNSTIYLGGAKVLRSTNGGSTWSQLPISSSGFPVVGSLAYDFHFFDENTGLMTGIFLVGGAQFILRTTDGGNDWTPVYESSDGAQPLGFNDLFFIDDNTGWAVGTNGSILKTTNGGLNWSQQLSFTQNELYAVQFLNANVGYAVGNGLVLKTTNGGAFWSKSDYPFSIEYIHFISPSVGYVGGWDFLWRTTDAGQNWQEIDVPFGTNFIRDIHFTDANTGYLLTQKQVLKTTDGGNVWEYRQLIGASSSLDYAEDFFWLNDDRAIAVGAHNVCMSTTNAGGSYLPIVGFEIAGNPTYYCPGQDYQLVNLTGAAPNYTYTWEIDNVVFSTDPNPILNLPETNEDYLIRLTVSNGVNTATATKSVNTYASFGLYLPNFNGAATSTICEGHSITVSTPSLNSLYYGNPIDYTFLANGVEVNAPGSNNSIYYNTALADTTLFQLVGKVATPCGDTLVTIKEKLVYVTPLPTALDVFAVPPVVCSGDSATIYIANSVPGVSYARSGQSGSQVGNGDTLFFPLGPLYSGNSGNYSFTVTNGSCYRNLSNVVQVSAVTVYANVRNWYGNAFVGDTITYQNSIINSPFDHDWEFGPLAVPPNSIEAAPTVVYSEPGAYTVNLTTSHPVAGCDVSASALVEVYPTDNQLELPGEVCYDTELGVIYYGVVPKYFDQQIMDITVGADGYTYATGYWSNTYANPDNFNLVLYKFDLDGNLVWSKITNPTDHGSSNTNFRQFVGTVVTSDAEGNVYIGGTFCSRVLVFDSVTVVPYSSSDYRDDGFLAKLDADGNLLWFDRFIRHNNDATVCGGQAPGPSEIIYLDEDNIYLSLKGRIVSYVDSDGGTTLPSPTTGISLCKLNSQGQIAWIKEIVRPQGSFPLSGSRLLGSDNSNCFYTVEGPDMRLSPDSSLVFAIEYRGVVYAGGETFFPFLDIDPFHNGNGLVVRVNLGGEVLNAFATYAVYRPSQYVPSVAIDQESNIYIPVNLNRYEDYDYMPTQLYIGGEPEAGRFDNYLLKYSPDGTLLWKLKNGRFELMQLEATAAGDLVGLATYSKMMGINDLNGSRYGYPSEDNFTLGNQQVTNLAVVAWDSDGAFQGARSFSTPNIDYAHQLEVTPCGDFRLAYVPNDQYQVQDTLRVRMLSFSPFTTCGAPCLLAITSQPQPAAFCAGSAFTFSVEAQGDGLTYQWQHNSSGSFQDIQDGANFQGTNEEVLQVLPIGNFANLLPSLQFRCIITTNDGGQAITSAVGAVPEIVVVSQYPPFVQILAHQQVVTLPLETLGMGIERQWQVKLGNSAWMDIDNSSLVYNLLADGISLQSNSIGFAGIKMRCLLISSNGCELFTATVKLVKQLHTPPIPKDTYPEMIQSPGGNMGQSLEEMVETEKSVAAIVLFPNPVGDYLNVVFSSQAEIGVDWRIMDNLGRTRIWGRVGSAEHTSLKLSVAEFPSGLYYFECRTEAGMFMEKFIKE